MAKSVLDAGWSTLKTMLEYKCDHAGVVFEKVNEAYTTQTCSSCGSIPKSSPKGRTGLGIREWTCNECGITHDRDINAAKNLLKWSTGSSSGIYACGDTTVGVGQKPASHVSLNQELMNGIFVHNL